MRVTVQCNGVNGRKALLGVLFSLGYVWNRGFGELTDPNSVETNYPFGRYPVLTIDEDEKGIAGTDSCRTDYQWPQDACEIINHFVGDERLEIIQDFLGYKGTITKEGIKVGCQFVTHEKFKELMEVINTGKGGTPVRKDNIIIRTKTEAQRTALICMLLGYGCIWHKDTNAMTNVEEINRKYSFSSFPYVVVRSNDCIVGYGESYSGDYLSWTEDFDKIVDLFSVGGKTPKVVQVQDVGEYTAVVYFNAKTVTFGKQGIVSFDAIKEVEQLVEKVIN